MENLIRCWTAQLTTTSVLLVQCPSIHLSWLSIVYLVGAAAEDDATQATFLALAAMTSARRGELLALRWSDIDFEDATVTFSRSVYDPKGKVGIEKDTKTHQARTISIDETCLAWLKWHRDNIDQQANDAGVEIRSNAFVFSESLGDLPLRTDKVSKFTKRIADKLGIKIHLHALRHFGPTEAIAAGMDPVTVSKRLGHARPSITLDIYSHALEQQDKELAITIGWTLAVPAALPLGK